jgi:hypothetical protein
MPGMSSTPVIIDVTCPYCHAYVGVEGTGIQPCADCGRDFHVRAEAESVKVSDADIERAHREDEQAAEERLYRGGVPGPEETRSEMAFRVGLETLLPLLHGLITNNVPGMGPTTPVAGKIACKDCAALLAGLRDSHHLLSSHLETEHAWWPHDMEGALEAYAKATARVARGLRDVHFTEAVMRVDPYEAAAEPPPSLELDSAPDTTGTPVASQERLQAVLARTGPSPLYDPETGDLDPAEPMVHVLQDDRPGAFLDGFGDAAPVPEDAESAPVN